MVKIKERGRPEEGRPRMVLVFGAGRVRIPGHAGPVISAGDLVSCLRAAVYLERLSFRRPSRRQELKEATRIKVPGLGLVFYNTSKEAKLDGCISQ